MDDEKPDDEQVPVGALVIDIGCGVNLKWWGVNLGEPDYDWEGYIRLGGGPTRAEAITSARAEVAAVLAALDRLAEGA